MRVAVLVGVLALAGCAGGGSGGGGLPLPHVAQAERAPRAGDFRLLQEPAAGFGWLYAQTRSAHHTIRMEMYELSDATEERALAAAAARGVAVHVMLDWDYSGRYANASAYRYLDEHGVSVRWAPQDTIFHIKAVVFDGTVADVSTGNLTPRYYRTDRDATVVVRDPADVRAIARTLDADWSGTPTADATVQAPGLVWSPGAEPAMLSVIRGARHAIWFMGEELSDKWVVDALAAAAKQGVACRIVMTYSSRWAASYRELQAAGCAIHVLPERAGALYIHEKALLADPGTSAARLLIGSQNATYTSLFYNRELSVLLSHSDAAGPISAVARQDAADFARAPALP